MIERLEQVIRDGKIKRNVVQNGVKAINDHLGAGHSGGWLLIFKNGAPAMYYDVSPQPDSAVLHGTFCVHLVRGQTADELLAAAIERP